MSMAWGSLGRSEYDEATESAEMWDADLVTRDAAKVAAMDYSRSGEGGPTWAVPVVAVALTALWLIGGYRLCWRVCRWFR